MKVRYKATTMDTVAISSLNFLDPVFDLVHENSEFVTQVASKNEEIFSTLLWEQNVVVHTILSATEVKYPSCQYLVGSDAKTVMLLNRCIPLSLYTWIICKHLNLPGAVVENE